MKDVLRTLKPNERIVLIGDFNAMKCGVLGTNVRMVVLVITSERAGRKKVMSMMFRCMLEVESLREKRNAVSQNLQKYVYVGDRKSEKCDCFCDCGL